MSLHVLYTFVLSVHVSYMYSTSHCVILYNVHVALALSLHVLYTFVLSVHVSYTYNDLYYIIVQVIVLSCTVYVHGLSVSTCIMYMYCIGHLLERTGNGSC